MAPFRRSRYDVEIFRLGLPVLGALAADPFVSLVDTAFVGRLGTNALGGLAVAAAVFGVAFIFFNFSHTRRRRSSPALSVAATSVRPAVLRWLRLASE